MILKEADKKHIADKYQKCGYEAEKQMAFYLKRAFGNDSDIHVINDLRVDVGGDVAQIDHLIVHRHGFIVIESKSVTSTVSVNEYGEWVRTYAGNSQGMPSPVQQAARQIEFLKSYLGKNSEKLLKIKKLFKINISQFKYDVLVAISDKGIINRPKKFKIDEVYKADQIVEEIKKITSHYKMSAGKLFTLGANYEFMDESFGKITRFLIRSHTPKISSLSRNKGVKYKPVDKDEKYKPKVSAVEAKESKNKLKNQKGKVCNKCKSTDIFIKYGKYGYYFKCKSCNGNNAIKVTCKSSLCNVRIRKETVKFFKECSVCQTSDLYFENPE